MPKVTQPYIIEQMAQKSMLLTFPSGISLLLPFLISIPFLLVFVSPAPGIGSNAQRVLNKYLSLTKCLWYT